MDNELKEFWIKCGFYIKDINTSPGCRPYLVFYTPNGSAMCSGFDEKCFVEFLPELNLDNLFKYSWDIALTVVMKTMECSKENAISLIFKWWEQNIYDGKTPTESLYQAIKQVILK